MAMALGPIEPEDVSELEACLQQATQPNVRAKLQRLLDDWRAELARGPARTAAPAPSASTPAIPMALPVPLPCAAGSTRPSTTSSFVPIETFGWDQEGGYPSKWVSVYVMSGIDGVGDLPKESVICRFERDSFDLQIRGLNGKDYRLVKTALEHDIKPEESKCIVKKNRVTLKLRKTEGQFGPDHWTALTKKRPTAGGADASKDPSAGIMDMMKDLYEEGDDTMRKTIGEAMLKSRQERADGSFGL